MTAQAHATLSTFCVHITHISHHWCSSRHPGRLTLSLSLSPF